MTPDGCTVRSVVQHSVVAKCPFPCWVGTDGAGCDRAPACSRSGCGCGCQSPWPSIDPLDGSRRTHAQQGQRILGLRFSEPGSIHEDDGLRTYLFGQCRCRGGGCTPHLSCDWLVLGPWGWVFMNTAPLRDTRGAVANITMREQYCIR